MTSKIKYAEKYKDSKFFKSYSFVFVYASGKKRYVHSNGAGEFKLNKKQEDFLKNAVCEKISDNWLMYTDKELYELKKIREENRMKAAYAESQEKARNTMLEYDMQRKNPYNAYVLTEVIKHPKIR